MIKIFSSTDKVFSNNGKRYTNIVKTLPNKS